jgi:hypothetical protein
MVLASVIISSIYYITVGNHILLNLCLKQEILVIHITTMH